jgi:hypothetical protein
MEGKQGCGCGGNSKKTPQDIPSDVRQFLGETIRNRAQMTSEYTPSMGAGGVATIDGAARVAIAVQDSSGGARPAIVQDIEQAARQALREVPGQQS